MAEFGIYVHTPYCVHKCSYCDFYSFTDYQTSDFAILTKRLIQELESNAALLKSKNYETPVTSIFWGGGTPSLMPVALIKEVLQAIQSLFPLNDAVEVTLEANPETLSEAYVNDLFSKTRVNRMSLGVQSFQEKYLQKLERLTTTAGIERAVQFLKNVGVKNFNLDFIFAIPEQTITEMKDDLLRAAAFGPAHISAYQLSLKAGHPMFSSLPSQDDCADYYEAVTNTLVQAGYPQYEISNYAKRSFECLHNLLYWSGGDYLGVGPSSASRFFWNGVFYHRKQWSDMKAYFDKPVIEFESTTKSQTILEASFLELRKNKGVGLEYFLTRYQHDFRKSKYYDLYMKSGFISESNGILLLTDKGRLLADTVTSKLVDI